MCKIIGNQSAGKQALEYDVCGKDSNADNWFEENRTTGKRRQLKRRKIAKVVE